MDITQNDDVPDTGSDPTDLPDEPTGGLGAVSKAPVASSKTPELSHLADGQGIGGLSKLLLEGKTIDPEMKNNAWIAGALAPTHGGGFSESLSNAYGNYSKAQEKEAELKAQYMPHVLQAMISAQLNQAKLGQLQFKMTEQHIGAINGTLTGLLSDPNATKADAQNAVGELVEQGRVPGDLAAAVISKLPDDPAVMRKYIMARAIGQQDAAGRVASVTPKLATSDSGGKIDVINTNATSGTPVGSTGVSLDKNLTPEQRLAKTIETKAGPAVLNQVTGAAGMVGTPEGAQVSQDAARSAGASLAPIAPGQVSATGSMPPPGVQATASTGGLPTPGAKPTDPMAPKVPFGQRSAADVYQQEEAPKMLAKYEGTVNDQVQSYQKIMSRLDESRKALAAIRTGASRPEMVKFAGIARDMLTTLGMEPNKVQALTDGIAGGDLASAQELTKIAIQSVLPNIRSDAGPNTRAAVSEFNAILKATPGLAMDPKAIEKIYNAMAKDYNVVSAQQSFINSKKSTPGYDISQIPSEWNKELTRRGIVQNQVTSGATGGKLPGEKTQKWDISTSASGKPVYKQAGTDRWVYGAPPQ